MAFAVLLLVRLSTGDLQADGGSGDSRSFTVDTRVSPVLGIGDSSLFTLDTRPSQTPSVAISGWVTDTSGRGLVGASVMALACNVVVATTATEAIGNYALPLLRPGTYEVRATKLDYLTGLKPSQAFSTGQAITLNFALAPRPDAPVVVPSNFSFNGVESTSVGALKLWSSGVWASGLSLDPAKTTVIITHGWTDNPGNWTSLADKLQARYGNTLNITAWDWHEGAGTGIRLSKAFYQTPKEGKALAQKLANDLPGGSRPPLHFIGHSLGTLVNATAANYLHDKVSPTFDWQKTHMTLLDNAVLANVEGALVSSGFYPPSAAGTLASDLLTGGIVWHTPGQAAWIDNYISLAGQPSTKAVNVVLELGPLYLAQKGRLGLNPRDDLVALHGYACGWYSSSVATPNDSPLGHKYSFENLGNDPVWPTPNPYARGCVLVQTSPTDELALAPVQEVIEDMAEEVARRMAKVSELVLDQVVTAVGGVVEAAGKVLASTVDEVWDGVSDGWGWGVMLTTASVASLPPPEGGSAAAPVLTTNSPAYARMTVAVPSNAATLTFTFSLEGEGSNDSFVFAINGTNLLTLETEFMPQGAPVGSGPIDVTAWKGQNVQMDFGIVGGTSTNASVTVKYLHFNTLTAPALKAAKADNAVVVSWPITATGYALESTPNLAGTNQWRTFTNVPGVVGFEQVVTNALSGTNEFFRLRRVVSTNQPDACTIPPFPAPSNMVWIPCGTFTMGSPTNEPARQGDEGPQTLVTISRGFWIGRYEVTQGEYLALMGNNPSYFNGVRSELDDICHCYTNVDYGTNLSRPVEKVTWNDAVAYCTALTAQERAAGRLTAAWEYRLPMEAQWEYACRAGTTTPFHYGNALRSGMANFGGICECPPCEGIYPQCCYNPGGINLKRTTSVGSYAPNAWGLFDMHGNVYEWCQDRYGAYPGGSVRDPQGPDTGQDRVFRGGAYSSSGCNCRSALRLFVLPIATGQILGFRMVLAPVQ